MGDFATFTSSGFALGQQPEHLPRVLVATTGPRGLALADAEADGVVVNWMAPDDLSRLPGLPTDASRIAMLLQVCPATDSELVDRLLRPVLTDYLNAPGYADLQRRLGRGAMLEQTWERFAAGDRQGARRALPRDIIDQLVVWGSPTDCRSRLDDIERTSGVRVVAAHVVPDPLMFVEAVAAQSAPSAR